jgi:hypothetical protein
MKNRFASSGRIQRPDTGSRASVTIEIAANQPASPHRQPMTSRILRRHGAGRSRESPAQLYWPRWLRKAHRVERHERQADQKRVDQHQPESQT